jgi:hypothetical protein
MVASDEPTRVKPSAVESVMISTDATALAPDAIRVCFANAAPRPGEHEGLLAATGKRSLLGKTRFMHKND